MVMMTRKIVCKKKKIRRKKVEKNDERYDDGVCSANCNKNKREED